MAINKALIVSSTMVALTLASFAGTGVVSAQSANISAKPHNKRPINTFARHNEERLEARHASIKRALDEAVKNGKITADQESQVLTKLQTLETNLDSLRDEAESKRKDDSKKLHAEFDDWLKANNIPINLLPTRGIPVHHRR